MKMKYSSSLHPIAMPLLIVLIIVGIRPFVQGAEDGQDKARARLSLDYFAYNNERYELEAEIKTKVDRVYQRVPGVVISFYVDSIHPDRLLGRDSSDKEGIAHMELPTALANQMGERLKRTYFAVLQNHPRFRDEDKSVEVQSAWLNVEFIEGDSLKTLVVSVETLDSNRTRSPVSDVPIRIFVDRSFGMLSLNEMFETTGENGRYEFNFPDDIPGDEDGELDVVVRVNDHFLFGNLINRSKVGWGVPVQGEDLLSQRELWSARANAPIWLILVANAIILGIWGILFYIVFQLFKIKKLGAVD